MKIDIFYYTATNNTLFTVNLAGEELVKQGHTIRTFNIESGDKPDFSADITGFFFPVMCFRIPVIMDEFIQKLPNYKGARVFSVYTCAGFEGNMPFHLQRKLEKKNYTYLGGKMIRCEESFPLFRLPFLIDKGLPDKKGKNGLIDFLEGIVKKNSQKNPVIPQNTYSCVKGFFDIIALFHNREMSVKGVNILIDRSLCTKCGRCIFGCPDKAIRVGEEGFPEVVKKDCAGCFKCINLCPENACNTIYTKRFNKYNGMDLSKIIE